MASSETSHLDSEQPHSSEDRSLESLNKLLLAKVESVKLSKFSDSLAKSEALPDNWEDSRTLVSWMTSQLDLEQPHRLELSSLESLNKLLQAKVELVKLNKSSDSLARSEASPDNLEARESFF